MESIKMRANFCFTSKLNEIQMNKRRLDGCLTTIAKCGKSLYEGKMYTAVAIKNEMDVQNKNSLIVCDLKLLDLKEGKLLKNNYCKLQYLSDKSIHLQRDSDLCPNPHNVHYVVCST